MKINFLTVLALIFLLTLKASAQESGAILIISDKTCKLKVDGEPKGDLTLNVPLKIEVPAGEHYLQCTPEQGAEESQIVTVEKQKQKVIKISFAEKQNVSVTTSVIKKIDLVLVASLNFEIPGQVLATIAVVGESTPPDEPIFHYVFEEGDEVYMDGAIENEKGSVTLEVTSIPENLVVYSNKDFKKISNEKFKVFKRGIYKFHFSTSHGWDRKCRFTLKRMPADESKINFNTTAIKRKKYKTVTIQEPSSYFINSISNEDFKGGKSKLIIPVTLPPNTIEWYYIASATRNEGEIKSTMKQFRLLGDLTKAISGISPTSTVLNIGLNLITQPPGANYCNAYLLDYANCNLCKSGNKFQYILQGSRENFTSTSAKVNCCNTGQYYLIFQNPDYSHGIHFGVEVVAILADEGFSME